MAHSIREELHELHPQLAPTFKALGDAYARLGKPNEALVQYRQGLVIARGAAATKHDDPDEDMLVQLLFNAIADVQRSI